MLTILAISAGLIVLSFWHAQKNPEFHFDVFDLLMENGKLSKISLAFMLVLAVSTWVIVDLQIKGKLDNGMFLSWLAAWVTPLCAKVLFNKSDVAGMTMASTTTTVEVSTPAPPGEPAR